jgi:8-oxo-dGTP diphosphatase
MPPPSHDRPAAGRAAGPALTPVQRSAAYAVIRDGSGRVLLVRASSRSDLAGHWFLPGGGLKHGESPIDAVRRELMEETGLAAGPGAVTPIGASGDVIDLPHRGASLHTVRLIFGVDYPGDERLSDLRPEPDGTSDQVRFVAPGEAATLPLMPFTAAQLGLPPSPVMVTQPERPQPLVDDASVTTTYGADEGDDLAEPGLSDTEPVARVQRPAAYAVLVSGNPHGNGRILLSKLTGSDLWTLPGGGIDHGEPPLAALEREVYEEAGLPYTPGPLLDISSRHFIGRAPSGRLEDFHGIRLLYAGSVPTDRMPYVVDVGGSSDDAAWFRLRELNRVRTVATVRHGMRMLRRAKLNGARSE